MIELNKFSLNKKIGGHKNCLLIKEFIEKFIEKEINSQLNSFSSVLGVPIETIKDKSKQIIFNKFNFQNGKFIFGFSFLKLFFDFLIFLFLIFSQIINFRRSYNSERKTIDVMLDNVTHTDEIYRFKNILKNYEKSLVVFKKKVNFDRVIFEKSEIFYNNALFKSSDFLNGKFKNLFFFSFKIFKISFYKKFNFFKIINVILNSTINYSSLFDNYNVKYLLHDRFYTTCPVRNYFLKQKCNGKSAAVQVHLAESAISLFVFSETIFTLGNEQNTKDKLIGLGGKINFSEGVGSLKMEHLLDYKLAKDNKKYFSDILIIGINITDWYYTSELTAEAYKKFLHLVKEISLTFPKKKIIYKHHSNFKWNKSEEKILNKSNVKMIIDKKEIGNKIEYISNVLLKRIINFFSLQSKLDTKFNSLFYGSYYYLLNSKFIISFGSTMVLEAKGESKNAFFINPGSLENPYTEGLDYLKEYIISDIEDLKEKILAAENSKLLVSDNENVCLKGDTSNLICNYINNQLRSL